jgi:hypothetical protein
MMYLVLPLNAATRPPDDDVLFTVISNGVTADDVFPAASVNEPNVMDTVAVPPTDDEAVNVAVYDVLLTVWKLLSVPNVALTSASSNVDVASLAVNVTVDVPPEFTEIGFALTVMVGTTPSITIAFAPAILLAPLGTVVEVIALPAVSLTETIVNDSTERSEVTSPFCTVYVPVSDVPAVSAVSETVLSTLPVSRVTVSELPDRIASLVVAAILIVAPTPYVPSAVDEENAVTVGNVVSIVTVRPEEVDVKRPSVNTVVACAVTLFSPAVSTPVSHDHAPVVASAAQVLPEATPSTNNCTVEPAGAEPVNVNVVADVRSSVDDPPKSSVA